MKFPIEEAIVASVVLAITALTSMDVSSGYAQFSINASDRYLNNAMDVYYDKPA